MKRIWLTVRMSIWGLGLFSGDLFASETVSEAKQLVESFSRGERTFYRSKGQTNEHGLDIEFQLPKPWKQRTFQKGTFTQSCIAYFEAESELGTIRPICYFQIREMADLADLTKEEVSDVARTIFSDKDIMRGYCQGISNTPITDFENSQLSVDSCPGTIFSARGTILSNQTSEQYPVYSFGIAFIYNSILGGLFIGIPKDENEDEHSFHQRYEIYKPMIRQIASTIKIHNQRTTLKTPVNTVPRPHSTSTTTKQPTSSQPYGVVVVKQIETNTYLCKRDGQRLVVDFSEHPSYKGRVLQRGSLIGGSFILQAEGTKQTMVNGKIETLPLVKLIESDGQ